MKSKIDFKRIFVQVFLKRIEVINFFVRVNLYFPTIKYNTCNKIIFYSSKAVYSPGIFLHSKSTALLINEKIFILTRRIIVGYCLS